MDPRDDRDESLSRLMRAVRAEPESALWTRARARIEAGAEPRGVIAWLMRPRALAASVATLAVASALSFAMVRDLVPVSDAAGHGLTGSLLDVARSPVDALEVPSEAQDGSPADSGETT